MSISRLVAALDMQIVSVSAEPASAKRFFCTVISGKPGQNHTINVKAERIQ